MGTEGEQTRSGGYPERDGGEGGEGLGLGYYLVYRCVRHFKKAALSTGDSPGGKRRATTSIGKDLPKPVGTAPIRC